MTAPDAPTSVMAVRGNAQATVSWVAPASNGGSPISQYTVTASPGGQFATTTGALMATVTGLTNGTSYTFTVRAANGVGLGQPSAASNAVVPATFPGAPTAPSAVRGNASATVSWVAPASNGGAAITSYTVTSSPGSFTATNTGGLNATVSGLVNGQSYTFTVKANNAVGAGASSIASNAVTPAGAPGAPGTPNAVRGNASATVSWTSAATNGAPITNFNVVSIPPGGSLNTAGTSGVVTGLVNGTTYTFVVTATNAVGAGPQSAPSNAVTPATVPGAPGTVVAVSGDSQASVTWTAPPNTGGAPITGYTVTSSPGGFQAMTPAGVTGAVVAGLTNGTTYTFTVTATNAVGVGALSMPSNQVVPGVDLKAIAGVSANDVWVVGAGGKAAHYNYNFNATPTGTNNDLTALYLVSSNDVWAIGKGGTALHYNYNWQTTNTGTTDDLNAIYGISSNDVWAVGRNGTAIHYNYNWQSTNTGTTQELRAIFGINSNDVWAVGRNGTAIHYNYNWQATSTGTTQHLVAIDGVNSNDVWAVGTGGTALHYNYNWQSTSTGTTQDLNALGVINANDVWAVGNGGTAIHYNYNWQTTSTGTTHDLLAIWVINSNDVWAVGRNGTALHYNYNWQTTTTGTTADLVAIWGTNSNDVWAVGKSGVVLHYTYSWNIVSTGL